MAIFLLVVGAGILFAVLLPPSQWTYVNGTIEGTAALIRSWGMWGVAGSLGLMILHSFLPFPAEVVALANGLVYGPLWGLVITWSGAMAGAALAFGLARALGRPFVERVLSSRRREQLDAWSRERGALALFIGRLIPLIAFNAINYAAGLTPMSWWTFLWVTGLGILPFTVVLTIVGAFMLAMPPLTLLLFVALTGVLVLAGWFALRHRRGSNGE